MEARLQVNLTLSLIFLTKDNLGHIFTTENGKLRFALVYMDSCKSLDFETLESLISGKQSILANLSFF